MVRSKLRAIAFIAAIGVASPVFAQGTYSPAETGGGSTGYNIRASTPNYRLKHHHVSPHTLKHHSPSAAK
jgi:hypothetical protein